MIKVTCRICRCILLDDDQMVEEHDALDEKPFSFLIKDNRSQGSRCTTPSCSHLFTKELPWMEPHIRGTTQGTLPCPKCKAKIGTFTWIGMQCSCGGWMVPAFALSKGKIDIIKTAAN